MDMMIYSILSVKNNHEKLNTLLITMKGISGTDLYAVSLDEISAIVSDIKRTDLIADRSNAIEYAEVIENLAQQFTLLPMRFGSLMESTDAIKKMLGRNYNEIQHNLQKVENKCEFGLKIFCDSEKLKAALTVKSEAGTKTPDKPAREIKNSMYKDYVNQKLKEHRLEELLLSYVESVIAEITGYLVRLNAVSKFKKMTTASTIIDAVFLLKKGRKDELIQLVADLKKQHPGLNFVLTGPWPPYNFVEITIK
ncbi:MAG: GvpL/GvpF family gas vesicle protein [Bacteroidales bacterium]|nr:GvpL/GvpF family gas vesicle protein [Bacteroidales bacterium]